MSGNVLKLFWLSLVLLLASCAHKQPEAPPVISFPGGSIRDALEEKKAVKDLDAIFSVIFEKTDSEIRGDGALNISSSGDMSLRVYSLGLLAMELVSKDGAVQSSPHLDRNKTLILTRGLKDCLFWWNLDDFTIEEDPGHFILKGPDREILLDKNSFLPQRQTVYFDDGRFLRIYYSNPVRENNIAYQSKIRIELGRYAVTLLVKNLSVKTGWTNCSYCTL